MEEEFVRRALGLSAERLTDGLVFRKRREWVNTLRDREEEIREFLERHGGANYPEAGYAQWRYLREKSGGTVETEGDLVSSAEKLEEILRTQPKGIPRKEELKRLALTYGALREVREALERADDAKIFKWYLEGRPFLEYVAPFIVLEAKKQGLNHRMVAEVLVKIVKERK